MSSSLPRTGAAAVAIIRCFKPEEKILILRRVAHPNDPWSGHFSFPGGRRDPEDQDLLTTCIRETREETGLQLTSSQLEASLPLEAAGHKFKDPLWVAPFLFTIHAPPPLQLDRREIQSGCWLDLQRFKDQSSHVEVEMYPGQLFPAYPLEDYYLWGFTYRLLRTIVKG